MTSTPVLPIHIRIKMEIDREIEMMLCMNHQGYTTCLNGETISFSIECMINMWDILKEDGEFLP